MSVGIASGLENWDDECKEEDLEDLEPVKSGGEPGAVAKVVISLRMAVGEVNERDRGLGGPELMPACSDRGGNCFCFRNP
jgi:hypothetical protein